MNPMTRMFDRNSSIDFGPVQVFSGLQRLALRLTFRTELPSSVLSVSRQPSAFNPFARGETPRVWCSQWGTAVEDQCFFLGQEPRQPLGSITFMVGDGEGNVAVVSTGEYTFDRCWKSQKPFRELVATFDASTGIIALTLDGVIWARAKDQTAVKQTAPSPSSHFFIGAAPNVGVAPDGLELADLSVWDMIEGNGQVDSDGMRLMGPAKGAGLLGTINIESTASRVPFRSLEGIISQGAVSGSTLIKPTPPDRPVNDQRPVGWNSALTGFRS